MTFPWMSWFAGNDKKTSPRIDTETFSCKIRLLMLKYPKARGRSQLLSKMKGVTAVNTLETLTLLMVVIAAIQLGMNLKK